VSKETADLILACIGITIGLCTLVGLAARFILMPWLREHLVTPIKETKHQVTVNQHVSPEPTLLDKLDSLADAVDDIQADQRTAARMFEGHIDRSGREWGRLWRAIEELDNRTSTTHRKDQRDD
jgi:hypothetical protein